MSTEEKTAIERPRAHLAMTASGFHPTDMDGAYRQAEWMSKSSMMLPGYRNNPANCLFLVEMSMGLGVRWQFLMQHLYMVHDRPALDAQITTGLVNRSGIFTDPLDYEVVGDDPNAKEYKVRATAVRASTGKLLVGPWITWDLVKGEGWEKKAGSKWLTMPEQMFHYRAASWFANRHCPEVKMGMMTVDEAEEIQPRKHVDSVTYPEAKEQAEADNAAETGSEETDMAAPEETEEEATAKAEAVAKDAAKKKAAATKKTKADAKAKKKEADANAEAGDGDAVDLRYTCNVCKETNNPKVRFAFAEVGTAGNDDHECCPKCFSTNFDDSQAFE